MKQVYSINSYGLTQYSTVSNQNIMTKVHHNLHGGQTFQHKSVTSDHGTVPDAVVFRTEENMLFKHANFGCEDVNQIVWEIRKF
jgi:hypothetical protein